MRRLRFLHVPSVSASSRFTVTGEEGEALDQEVPHSHKNLGGAEDIACSLTVTASSLFTSTGEDADTLDSNVLCNEKTVRCS